jgi:hypothetical protein
MIWAAAASRQPRSAGLAGIASGNRIAGTGTLEGEQLPAARGEGRYARSHAQPLGAGRRGPCSSSEG